MAINAGPFRRRMFSEKSGLNKRITGFTTPYNGLYSCRKIIPMAADEIMLGMIYTFLANFTPFTLRENARAIKAETGICTNTPRSAHIVEFRRASQKYGYSSKIYL